MDCSCVRAACGWCRVLVSTRQRLNSRVSIGIPVGYIRFQHQQKKNQGEHCKPSQYHHLYLTTEFIKATFIWTHARLLWQALRQELEKKGWASKDSFWDHNKIVCNSINDHADRSTLNLRFSDFGNQSCHDFCIHTKDIRYVLLLKTPNKERF